MDLQTSCMLFVILLPYTCGIQLEGHGYTGVLIAINPSVSKNETLLENIENMVRNASHNLYGAVGNRFYFKEVTILVPPNWNGTYNRTKYETYDKANVIIDEPNEAYGDEPYTLQYGQCGEEGKYIHLTPNFMLDDKHNETYGERAKVFVHEWAHLRWGVYDEYNEEQPVYLSSEGLEGTRCSKEVEGQYCARSGDECLPCETTELPNADCLFLPNENTTAKESIMAFPSLSSVIQFCSTETHNAEAPNTQNHMCGNRAVMDVILNSSVDAGVPESSAPLPSMFPTVRIVQRKTRVLCLVLDVSTSMQEGHKFSLLKQAATLFLREIIEDTAHVGIVKFSSSPTILKSLTVIDGEQSRENLISALPTFPPVGGTQMCLGIEKGLEVVQEDGNTEGDELVLLSDGEAQDYLGNCFTKVISSGAVVHTIALGEYADKLLRNLSHDTGGEYLVSHDSIDSNALIDSFASLTTSSGNLTLQKIQLESAGNTTTDWFNGTFSVDWTVGDGTAITIVYEATPPTILIESPSEARFNQSHFNDTEIRTMYLKIPAIAEIGEWHYSILNGGPNAQAMAITVTTRASSADVDPITVKAHMSQKSSDGSKAMVVYAVVSQKGRPVILANVTATLESANDKQELKLLDNGAGADAFRHDGIYSRYFIKLHTGRYSLKVKVQNTEEDNPMLSIYRHSGAPYVPGYVVNGQVQLNPPKPPVNHQPVEVGSFSRTATGESFVVDLPPGYTPAFPPCKITDLKASLEGDNITLTWTAPGESYDQGTASLYHIHWSEDLASLKGNFSGIHLVNTSGLTPQEAGATEEYTFLPYNITITNGTILFIAVTAENTDSLKSEISNIVRIVNFIPAPPVAESTNVVAIAVGVTVGLLVVVMVIGGIIFWRRRH